MVGSSVTPQDTRALGCIGSASPPRERLCRGAPVPNKCVAYAALAALASAHRCATKKPHSLDIAVICDDGDDADAIDDRDDLSE